MSLPRSDNLGIWIIYGIKAIYSSEFKIAYEGNCAMVIDVGGAGDDMGYFLI